MSMIISPEAGAELEKLYKEYPAATALAAKALRTNGAPLEGAALKRFLEEDAKVSAIVGRIKEILGVAGQARNR